MKTILILGNSSAGLVNFRLQLVKALRRSCRVVISLPDEVRREELDALGCVLVRTSIDRRGTNPGKDLRLLHAYRELMRNIQPDLVLTYTIKPNIYGGMACAMAGIPCIATVTGLGSAFEKSGPVRALATALYRRGLRHASCVFFQNTQNKEIFEKLGLLHGPARLVPGSGVDLAEHRELPYPEDGQVRFLYIGRIMQEKGVYEYLEAARRLHSPEVVFYMLGYFDEDVRPAFEQAEKEGVIRLLGFHTNVDQFYGDCSAVVLPTYHEGMSNVLMEASACGRPVIATRISGCREIFEEGKTGLGCEPGSADSLTEALSRFLAMPVPERAAMGHAARLKMEREFDRRSVTAAYLEEVEKAAGGM